jgi:hypothetical protein
MPNAAPSLHTKRSSHALQRAPFLSERKEEASHRAELSRTKKLIEEQKRRQTQKTRRASRPERKMLAQDFMRHDELEVSIAVRHGSFVVPQLPIHGLGHKGFQQGQANASPSRAARKGQKGRQTTSSERTAKKSTRSSYKVMPNNRP